MPNYLVVILFVIGAVAFFAVALSITLMVKGHHIESEISTNPNMKKLGIKCAVQETREDIAAESCETDTVCTGNCAGCDIDHNSANK